MNIILYYIISMYYVCIIQAFIQDFRLGGGGDSTPRGVWGHVPPGKCQIMSILNGFFGGRKCFWEDIPGLPPLYESLLILYYIIYYINVLCMYYICILYGGNITYLVMYMIAY